MTDFSVPQRMSGSAFVVIFAKMSRQLFSMFMLAFIIKLFSSDFDGDTGIPLLYKILIFFAFYLGMTLLLSCADYFPKKFYVRDGNLIFTYGLFYRRTSTIPLDHVHALRTRRGVIYRILDMRGVSFDTLASDKEEVELILDESDWQSLLHLIEAEEQAVSMHPQERNVADDSPLRFCNKSLVIDALCQNHLKGMAVLGGFLAVVFNGLNDISDNAAGLIVDYATDHADDFALSLPEILSILVAGYLIVLGLWMGKVLMRYYDMTLSGTKTLLTFNFGMFSRSSCRFAFSKICTIWVKRNILEKHFGCSTIMLRQALNATKDKEEDNLKLYGSDRASLFLGWWLGDGYATEPVLLTARSGRGLLTHILLPAIVISTIAAIILWEHGLYVWLILPAIYLSVKTLNGIMAFRRSRITLRDTYVVVDNGRFAQINNYIKYSDIEVVRITRSPFTRWFHRVTLSLSTPGSSFKIRSLREEEAVQIYELMLCKIVSDF